MIIYSRVDPIIIFCAKYLIVALVALWWVAWAQAGKKMRSELAIATLLAAIVATALDKILSSLYYDPRPFVSQGVTPLISHAADNGFPSEHTLFGVTLAFVLFLYRPKLGLLAIALALIIGIARVLAHVHSPIDILGGILIGIAAGYAGYLLAPKIQKRVKQG